VKTVTAKWTRPPCSWCGDPIERVEDAYAGWYEDDEGQSHNPQIVHAGGSGCRYYHRFPNGHLRLKNDAAGGVLDIPVKWFRRCPMEAICIAMRRKASDEAERIVWHAWLSIVLGLPFPNGDMAMVALFGGVNSNYIPSRIPTLDELRSEG
jgi:hypothetical protein